MVQKNSPTRGRVARFGSWALLLLSMTSLLIGTLAFFVHPNADAWVLPPGLNVQKMKYKNLIRTFPKDDWTFNYHATNHTIDMGGHVELNSDVTHLEFSYDAAVKAYRVSKNGDNTKNAKAIFNIGADHETNSILSQTTGKACKDVDSIFIYSFLPNKGVSLEDATDAILQKGPTNASNQKKVINVEKSQYAILFCGDAFVRPFNYLWKMGGAQDGTTNDGTAPLEFRDYNGTVLDTNTIGNDRFRFLSPFNLVDTATPLEAGNPASLLRYQAVENNGTAPDNFNIENGNDYLMNDGGIILLRPIDGQGQFIEKAANGECLGFFAMKTGAQADKYLIPYYVPTKKINDGCLFGTDNNVAGYKGFLKAPYPESLASHPLPATWGGEDSISRRLAFASFQWVDSETIKPIVDDAGRVLKKQQLADSVMTEIRGLLPSYAKDSTTLSVWSTDQCKSSPGYYSIVAINYDPTKTITDWDTANRNTVGFVLTPNGSRNGFVANQNGDSMMCLLGHEIKKDALWELKHDSFLKIFPGLTDDGGVLISYPGKAVNNQAGSIADKVAADLAAEAAKAKGNSTLEPGCKKDIANPLTWLVCPIFDAAKAAVDQFDRAIISQMTVDLDKYFQEDPNKNTEKDKGANTAKALHKAWSNVRNLALGILVIAGLVMVVAQALDVGPFDAYTVKKILPRILVAGIAMAISWQLVQVGIEISNGLGVGVRTLIQAPFVDVIPSTQIKGGTSAALTLVSAGALVGLGLIGLLSFALTALLAVVIGFATLVFRQMLILLLVILAPFAIACYILPNTQKAWKLWYDSFLGALLVFPIITAFIAIGRVFSAIAGQQGGGLLSQTISLIAYFAPYFLLPTAFKLAGGLLTTIGGMANDRSRGPFDRLKKFRQGKTSENLHKLQTGDRFQGRNALSRQFNRRTQGLGGGWSGSHFGFGARGKAYRDIQSRASAEEATKNNALLRQLAYDDNGVAVLALSGGSAAGAERAATAIGLQGEARKRALASAASVGYNNSNALAAINLMGQNKSRALPGGQEGMELVRQSAAQISGGDRQMTENVVGGFAFASRGAGRFDLGGEKAGESLTAGWQRAGVGQHMQAFGASTQTFANHFAQTISTSADHNERRAAAVALAEMQGGLPSATAENQTIINEAMAAVGIDHNLTRQGISVEQQLANVASARPTNYSAAKGGLVDATTGAVTPVAGPADVISAEEIHGLARKYGAEYPAGQRGQEPPT